MTMAGGGAEQAGYVDRVMQAAIERAGAVIDEVFRRLDVPKPDQAELRERFQEILAAPDDVTYQQEYQRWLAELGQAEWDRQMHLMVLRGQRSQGGE